MSRARSVADLGNQSLNLSVSDGALKVGAGATVENTGESQFAGIVTATKFVGDGSGLTGVTGTGSGVVVQEEGSNVGTAATINFVGSAVTATISGGVATVEISSSGGGGDTVSIESSATDILSVSSGAISADDAGADKLVFWDDSAGKLTYLTVGSNLTVSDTTITASGSGGSGISSVFEDTTPRLSGNLDANSKDITGISSIDSGSGSLFVKSDIITFKKHDNTENIAVFNSDGPVNLFFNGSKKFETTSTGAEITGNLTATSFSGSGANLTNLPAGQLTGALPSLDGSALTGVTASGTGVVIKHDGSTVGTAATINFGTNLDVSALSAGIVTITASGGGSGISSIFEDTTPRLGGNLDANSKDITGTGNVNLTGISTFGSTTLSSLSVGSALDITSTNSASTIQADNSSQEFYIQGLSNNLISILAGTSNQGRVTVYNQGKVELAHAGNVKFETTSTGAEVFGNFIATTFSGDGSALTGVVTSIVAGSNITLTGGPAGIVTIASSGVSDVVDDTTPQLGGNLDLNGKNIIGTGNVNLTGVITATSANFTGNVSVGGTLTYEDVTNIDSIGIVTARAGIKVLNSAGADISGVVTATTFSGSGASLTNLPAANITGTLPAISGANLTTLNASELDSGIIPGARFPDVLPVASGANLTNLPSEDTDVQVTYDISANGNNYRITGPGHDASENNPDLYLVRGQRYRFINTTGSSHPFRIQSDTSGTQYTDGVTGDQDGTQDFNVQNDAPVRLYYQCTIHGSMIGNIYIVGGSDWRMSNATTAQTPNIFTNLNVGIGISLPAYSAHIHNSGTGSDDNAFLHFTTGDTGSSGTQGLTIGVGADENAFISQRESARLIFSTGGSERLGISSIGELVNTFNIGGAGDAVGLFINNTSAQTGNIAAVSFSTDSGNRKKAAVGLTQMDSNGSGHLVFCVDGADTGSVHMVADEKLRITNSGYIGVKNSFPLVSLDLSETTDAIALPTGTTAQRPSGTDAYIRKNSTNNALEFYNGTEWVEIITDYFPTGSTILG